jgi:hypothetical protein
MVAPSGSGRPGRPPGRPKSRKNKPSRERCALSQCCRTSPRRTWPDGHGPCATCRAKPL